jgi:cell division septum initiation protein DivIVA
MVNRAATTSAIDDIMRGLDSDLENYANDYLAEHAASSVRDAQAESERLISESEIVRESNTRAAQILARARAEADELLVEADRYVETRLAAFEAELQVTMSRVTVMRDRLQERSRLNESSDETTVLPRWHD